MTTFVDTSVWYAAADRGDSSNSRAKAILGDEQSLVTTDHVLLESWMLVHHRLGRNAAETFWAGPRGGAAGIETVHAADLESAWAIGRAYVDQDFSLTDRTSFAVMERLGLHRVASFDQDFAICRVGLH